MSDNANQQPPLLIAHAMFVRVVRIARFNGISVLGIAGTLTLLVAASGDVRGAALGLLVAGSGAMELHGVALLRHGHPNGADWLIRSQLFLLIVMLGYCALRIVHVDLEPMRLAFHEMLRWPPMQEAWRLKQAEGVTEDQFLRQSYSMGYITIAIATLLYQGGMAIYYFRRRDTIVAALADE